MTATRLAAPDTGDPLDTLEFLRVLRQAAGEGAGVEWQADLPVPDTRLLHHLPPPVAPYAEPALPLPALLTSAPSGPWPGGGAGTAWRAAYRPGLCHYRLGPGFVRVSDGRGGPVLTTTLTGESAAALRGYLDVGPAPVADPAFDELVRLGLILPLGGLALTLPYRIRRWPIPCTSI